MKTALLIVSLALAVTMGLSACQRSDRVEAARDRRDLTTDEKEFIEYAAEMHAGEIKLAQLAKEKTSRDDIKKYADTVIADHTDSLANLSAKTEQTRTPHNTNASLDTKNHSDYLSPLSGAEFDREFIALMVADHRDAANVFKEEMNKTQNSDLKGYMEKALPRLEKDLSQAQSLNTMPSAK